jgi:hypothetical protein
VFCVEETAQQNAEWGKWEAEELEEEEKKAKEEENARILKILVDEV